MVSFLKFLIILLIILISFSASKEFKDSSKTKTFGFLYKPLDIPILCLCPPLYLNPFSPILLEYFRGKE